MSGRSFKIHKIIIFSQKIVIISAKILDDSDSKQIAKMLESESELGSDSIYVDSDSDST